MRHLIRVLSIVAGSIWLISTLYVTSNPDLNTSLSARKPESVTREQQLLAHLAYLKDQHASLEDICQQYRLLSIHYFTINSYDEAETCLLHCLKLIKDKNNLSSGRTLSSMTYNMLGDLWEAQSEFQAAEVLYRKAMGYCANDSFLLAKSRNNLGVLYYLWGKATSESSLRSKRLLQSKDLFQSCLAQRQAIAKSGEAIDVEFFWQCLNSNYEATLNDLNELMPRAFLH